MIATASLMVGPSGRVRFSRTVSNPHRALASAGIGCGVLGHGPGSKRGDPADRAPTAGADAASLAGAPANRVNQHATTAAAPLSAGRPVLPPAEADGSAQPRVLCFPMRNPLLSRTSG
ncbi:MULTISPECIES: hypothetical protein [unclassified Kitasatospora]|uniref:hypothetical protein n=1 Tax=unclassified Kitasatospora TaxID=2633591 RepID=UPI0024751836|nr:hypothetical protein [Kitasatospora sp. MAP12-44]